MIEINDELELFALKGSVIGGKILLFKILESQNLSKEDIRSKVVDEYHIMKPKHFIHSYKEFQRMKPFMRNK